jgi:hypothetical protein
LACSDPALAKFVYDKIGELLQLPGEATAPFENLGLLTSFNGVDLLQTPDHTKLSCESYLRRLLTAHHWETPTATERQPGSRPPEPLSHTDLHAVYHSVGPAKHTPEHAALEK